MAKLDGIDPKKGRKTLGQALLDLADSSQLDDTTLLHTAHVTKGIPETKDSVAATAVMTRPNYPVSENSLQKSANANPTPGANLEQGLYDISPGGLKAAGSYAKDALDGYNDFAPSEVASEATGGRRGDHLTSAETNDAETFTSKVRGLPGIQSDLAVGNFERLSGGDGTKNPDGEFNFLSNKQSGFFSALQVQNLIDKIGAGNDPKLRSLLLAAVRGENLANNNARPKGDVAAEIHDNLQDANRYSPSENSPYIKNPTASNEEEFYNDGLFSIQVGAGRLGVYNKNGKGIKTMDLSRMAMQLMLSAQSHSSLAGDIDEAFAKGEAGGGSFLFDIAALIPGLTQIGAARIEQGLMRIKNTPLAAELGIAGRGADDIIPVESGNVVLGAGPSSKTDGQIDPRSAGSYGQMNSFVEPFDGPMPFGMFFIALYSILGVMVLSLLIDGIVKATGGEFLGEGGGYTSVPETPETLVFGRSTRNTVGGSIGDLFMELFGLPVLNHNFFNCLLRGLEKFYDIPSIFDLISGDAGFEEVLESAINLALAPGYYATITKQVLRDFEQITESILALGQNASVFNVIAGIFKVVESLFSSFTFRFVVFLANIGDIDLLSRNAPGVIAHGETVATVDFKGTNGALNPTPFMRGRVSRFKNNLNPHSLHTYITLMKSPAFGQLDAGIFNLIDNIKPSGEGAKLLVSDLTKARVLAKREAITKDQVREVEDAINAEYMPFYIHDLRTEEIFSMPAFITDFSEDFAPEYNESHGYGRTDPVLIYSKTRRNIALNFRLVSFNKTDHDQMWFLINKLVAMCYPQRSPGQKRVIDNDKFFIQPFSQVPTASPLVRIRVGDVVKSNYSKIGLGRLFGLFGAPGKSNVTGEDSKANIHEEKIAIIEEAVKAINDGEAPSLPLLIPPGATVRVFNKDSVGTDQKVLPGGDPNDITVEHGVVLKVDKVNKKTVKAGTNSNTAIEIEGELASISPFGSIDDAKKKLIALPGAIKLLEADLATAAVGGSKEFPFPTVRGKIVLAGQDAKPYYGKQWDLSKLSDEAGKRITKGLPNASANVNFMDANNNPIVASFESSRGRGLAGFITQLSFDYSESNWETIPGSRGPQSVGVSMTFSPVHDLPLGFDADGNLLAPSQPVGGLVGSDPYDELSDFGVTTRSKVENAIGEASTKNFAENVAGRKGVNLGGE